MKASWVMACSGILFVMACSAPALEFRRNEDGLEIWPGIGPLCLGWLGPFMGCFAWFANPLLVLALILLHFRRNVWAAICAGLALLVSLNTWSLFSGHIPGDEGGVNKLFLRQIREGTYLWMSSMAVVLIGALVLSRLRHVEEIPEIDSD